MNVFQPADIVLIHAKGFSFLRLITGMYFNHACIIDEQIEDDYGVLESIEKGTSPTLLSDYSGQEVSVYRYKGIKLEQQQKVRLALRKMGRYRYDIFLPLRVIKRFGLKRTFKTIVKLWTKQYPLEIPHIEDDWVVCSEYIQEGFEKAGIPLLPTDSLLIPDSLLFPPVKDKVELVWQGIL